MGVGGVGRAGGRRSTLMVEKGHGAFQRKRKGAFFAAHARFLSHVASALRGIPHALSVPAIECDGVPCLRSPGAYFANRNPAPTALTPNP